MNALTVLATPRFVVRTLVEDDVSPVYLSWLHNAATAKFIETAGQDQTLQSLRDYVRQRLINENCEFFGVFERVTGLHIGNIKFEPISTDLDGAVMGVLIGDPAYRGKGVFAEVFKLTSEFVAEKFDVTRILLGVDEGNHAAVQAYAKYGFTPVELNAAERHCFGNVSMTFTVV